MIGNYKGDPQPSIYTKSPSPAPTDPQAIITYLSRELGKLEATIRRLDERLKAGSL
jgi:hypothetical protein